MRAWEKAGFRRVEHTEAGALPLEFTFPANSGGGHGSQRST
ncbi:hypothetical protein [Streptomyces sp. RB110-2]